MKKLAIAALISTVSYFVISYRKFKEEVLIRHSAGESDYERHHKRK